MFLAGKGTHKDFEFWNYIPKLLTVQLSGFIVLFSLKIVLNIIYKYKYFENEMFCRDTFFFYNIVTYAPDYSFFYLLFNFFYCLLSGENLSYFILF